MERHQQTTSSLWKTVRKLIVAALGKKDLTPEGKIHAICTAPCPRNICLSVSPIQKHVAGDVVPSYLVLLMCI